LSQGAAEQVLDSLVPSLMIAQADTLHLIVAPEHPDRFREDCNIISRQPVGIVREL
jgi:hypothetical protein